VRKFSFQKIDGKLTEPIEIDGCPVCASFWLDAGELQKLSPPVNGEGRIPRIEANALAVVLEVLLQLPIILL
ncbi:MAG TPA: zf-TFIIB domain-containing protein, partial [Candidatus Thalassarchaeaceae archaeon]|nr:zf-TFIIB domain-containing protein [Candidatus Thalassarchaeaceae archaeon]